jgi:hypothetical protein
MHNPPATEGIFVMNMEMLLRHKLYRIITIIQDMWKRERMTKLLNPMAGTEAAKNLFFHPLDMTIFYSFLPLTSYGAKMADRNFQLDFI